MFAFRMAEYSGRIQTAKPDFCLFCWLWILPLKSEASATLASPLFVLRVCDGDLDKNTDFQTIQTYT